MDRWIAYLQERFPVFLMILLVSGISLSGIYLYNDDFHPLAFILSFIGLFFFFALLRLMDEVKDLEKDRIAHKERPLPRGLIKKEEALLVIYGGTIILFAYSMFIWVFLQSVAALAYVILTIFLWGMYKEFGVSSWLNRRPVYYAITHQLVAFLVAIFAVSVAAPEKALAPMTLAYGLLLMGAFFCYEICRKLDPHAHPILATYLHFYGFKRTYELAALMLVLSAMAAIALGLVAILLPIQIVVLVCLSILFFRHDWFRLPDVAASISLLIHVWAIVIHRVL